VLVQLERRGAGPLIDLYVLVSSPAAVTDVASLFVGLALPGEASWGGL
jgi:hypothetical protein